MFPKSPLAALLAVLALIAVSTPAFAHPGHGAAEGVLAGFAHPLSGLDHLLAMIAVGVWAAQLGSRAVWAVPAAFVSLMALGAAMTFVAADSVAAGAIESGIAASLLVLGLLIWRTQRMPLAGAAVLVGLFGLLHGAAHAAELPQSAEPLRYAAGFIAATVLLHVVGVFLGTMLKRHTPLLGHLGGAAVAATGLVLLVGGQ